MTRLLVFLCCIVLFVPNCEAQQQKVVEFADQFEKRFAGRPPMLGSLLADASAFDEQGNPFELSQTRGKFTVFVFGCLT